MAHYFFIDVAFSLCYNIVIVVVSSHENWKGVSSMDKNTVLKEMIYEISDEIGTDISYVSSNQNGYQYLTGIDFTMILTAGISSIIFIPLIKAFANKLGEELANTAIDKLKKNADQAKKQLQERDTNGEIVIAFIKIIPDEIFATQPTLISQKQEVIKVRQITAVQEFLESNCFPHEKATLLAEQIYEIMNDSITGAIDESE